MSENAHILIVYDDDINFSPLRTKVEMLSVICVEEKSSHIQEIVKVFNGCDRNIRLRIPFIVK